MLYALRRKRVECGKEYKNYSDIILCNKKSHVPEACYSVNLEVSIS